MTRAKATTFDATLAAEVAVRVKARRYELGMTQRELALAAEITHGQVAFIELAKSVPGGASILGLSRALQMTPNELLGWEDHAMATTKDSNAGLPPAPSGAVPEIRFYRANDKPYGVFSNLHRSPVEFEGEIHPTAEHAYQAGKARKPEVRAWILAAPSPSLLAMAAHGLYSWDIAPGWSAGRYGRMRRVVGAKFGQHPALAEILVGTGDARLVESATVDNPVNRRWGEVDGIGTNWLGLILMEVREVLVLEASR